MIVPFFRDAPVRREPDQGSPNLDRPLRTKAQAISDIKAAGAAEERMRIAGPLADRASAIEREPNLFARRASRDFRRMAVLLKRGLV